MEALQESISLFLEEIYDNFRRWEGNSFSRQLTLGEMHVLDKIPPGERRKMSELAAAAKITTASITAAVDKLADKGCIVRERAEDDRRVVWVTLTRRGEAAYRMHKQFHAQMVKAMTQGFSKDETRLLHNALQKLADYVSGSESDQSVNQN